MEPQTWLAFVAATVVLILIPGPNVTLLVANSLTYGPRRALVTLAGTSTAIALQLLGVALGLMCTARIPARPRRAGRQ
jgi:threonine/homoserine/homoserine lactone efflux protein